MNYKFRLLVKNILSGLLVLFLFFDEPTYLVAAEQITISLITDHDPAPPFKHGLYKLKTALQKKGIVIEEISSLESAKGAITIVTGLSSGNRTTAELLRILNIPAPKDAESLIIRHVSWNGKKVLLVSGADDRGLMYALLDVADRIGWAENPQNPLSEVQDTFEKPAVAERVISIYTMSKSHFESHFYIENYWKKYFEMLVENRFNTFALLFAYESGGYFAPPYPDFFDVEEFPEVQLIGITKEKQQKNLETLNRLIKLAHDYGLNVTIGIWDHIYRGGVQGPDQYTKQPTPGLVWGLTEKNLMLYTKAALTKFIKLVPDINTIQFRMHGESGLKKEEMNQFWENIYQVMKRYAPTVRFDARAKDFPDTLINRALELGVNIRLNTKYWMEQMGLPFHPTHINRQNQFDRRHGYADMLRYPQRYKMMWQLWTGGTSRILLWGDPEYVRRFTGSTHLYNGEGFEINEPLATKMATHHNEKPFDLLRPQYQYYEWEFERYWHFFQLFGRLGYNPDTPAEVWQKEFGKRFGKDAGPYVEHCIHMASRILPRIIAYCFPYNLFPTTRGWAEKQRQEDLPKYANADASDTQQFLSMNEAAKNCIEGNESAKISPEASGEWFAHTANYVLEQVNQAEKRIGERKNKEFFSTMVDMKILANLALYHSWRSRSGLSYALFKHSQDINALDDAIKYESEAIGSWEKMVEAAGDVYNDNLIMGLKNTGLDGHWRDELVELNRGLTELKSQRENIIKAPAQTEPVIAHVPVSKVSPNKDLTIKATIRCSQPVTAVKVRYINRSNQFYFVAMEQKESLLYHAVIPGSEIVEGFRYFIQVENNDGKKITSPPDGVEHPVAVMVTTDNEPPVLVHKPITIAAAEKPLTITADVKDPSGVKWVRVLYRGVNQYFDYQNLQMLPTGKENQYQAVIPGNQILPEWDFMYLFEVMDNKGNGKIYPDLEKETPYIVVKLERN